jgi:hypothetical protein
MARIPSLCLLALLFAALAACATPVEQRSADEIFWRFDRLDRVGGAATHVDGQPRLINTGAGRAIAFDGVDDALFVDRHPLAGARAFTMEAVFRPDGGAFEQRWLHLAEVPGARSGGYFTAAPPSGPRFLFEIRVTGMGWYLDTFVAGPGYNKALIFPEKLLPMGRWYHVAQTYDGRVYRSYVNGELQGEAEIAFQPQGAGYASVGTRIDRRSYFQGAVFSARFLPRALAPAHFMRVPARLAD